ncbi:MAG TPA: magnesium chelatase domain-containing protein [Actinomycetota bacterium]|nr:magnesium chelatase domain-containing protein [Actinomycetota bacterium]
MLAKAFTVAFVGAEARLVEVEVRVGAGLPGFKTVGLAAKSVTEADQRIRSAIEVTGQRWPGQKIIANLAPGALPKEGTHFDLALALCVIAADGKLESEALDKYMIVGELGLDGSVRGIRGTLSAALECAKHGYVGIICPEQNAAEAALVKGIEIVPVGSLAHCLAWMNGKRDPSPIPPPSRRTAEVSHDLDEVRGHQTAKRAMEIAAAGGHNLLTIGFDTPVYCPGCLQRARPFQMQRRSIAVSHRTTGQRWE